jgi:GTP diphosphokinase / guanosine-3',5'-bis(diphosphate) 3'-diphosphatase
MTVEEQKEVDSLLSRMKTPTTADRALIEKAYLFAKEAHKDHVRFSGKPYLVHLVATAYELASIGMGPKVIAAGLLHDTIEDTGTPPETIEKEFGKEVLFMVEGVTKLGHLKYHGAVRHRESLRKLLVATSRDVRVLIIKLMDRLHNMRTLSYVPEEKRHRIAMETLEIYAPIAHRLGMSVVRKELEDLAFEYAYPSEWFEMKEKLTLQEETTRVHLEEMSKTLSEALTRHRLRNFVVDYRVKGLYSLWRKLERKGGELGNVYDVEALRVIVDSIAECYRALGIVHELWQPLPGKIKDYIAFPKPNGYRSLHTTIFSGTGAIVEVQIRTRRMHEEAQLGIASHVLYKEHGPGEQEGGGGGSFEWIKSLLALPARFSPMQRIKGRKHGGVVEEEVSRAHFSASDNPEWLSHLSEDGEEADFEGLKSDIFSHRVFVFTPKGDVIDLPANSSPVDFAFAIHSDIGNHTAGAKVNGKMVPIDTPLHNGDIVFIDTRRTAHPTQKWLGFAKTALARRHIRMALEKLEKKN